MWVLLGWLLLVVALGSLAWGGWSAAPFLPTRRADVDRLLRLANLRVGDVLYDLGAGDGRIVIAAARHSGVKAIGFEVAIVPVLYARWKIWRAGVRRQAEVRLANFFRQDLSAATVVVCFLTPAAMAKLAPRFNQQLHPGTRVVSYAFPIPGWDPIQTDKPSNSDLTIYSYVVGRSS